MAEEETQQTNEAPNENVLTILSMVGGLGIVTMLVAAGIGVVWENADTGLIGVLVMAGAGLLVAAIGGWVLVVRPHENFDDISVPMYHGHHHDDDHEHDAEHADESDSAH